MCRSAAVILAAPNCLHKVLSDFFPTLGIVLWFSANLSDDQPEC